MSAPLNAKIKQVFDEPGCGVNQGKSEQARKKGCTRQLTPGAAAGGCAFDGAKIALQPIVDVAHLVHGPIACEGNSWDNRHSASSGPVLYRTGLTTDINEFDVIYGAEKRLFKAVREVIEKLDPPAVFVYQTCVTAMIGDDIEAVCQRATQKFGRPVIPVNAPGFAGPKNLGNKLGAEALLDYVIGTVEPTLTTPTDINIIGEYNLSGELWQVKPLLDALGVRILSCISGDGRYHEVAAAHRARVNMVVCSKSMINIATRMQQRWGIPFFEGSFYGIGDMSTSLREIARLLVERGGPADLPARAEALIAVEEARAFDRIRAYRQRLQGKRVLLITGGVKSWSVVSALQEAGLEVVGTSVKKSTKEDKQKIRDIMGLSGEDSAHMIDDMSPKQMYAMLRDARADIMLSGGRSQFVALKARMPWMDINQERHHAFAGYEGMVTMVAEIDKALFNPVWAQVRSTPPWEALPAAHDAIADMASNTAADRATDAALASARTRKPAMAHVTESKKACSVNPLKMSQPLGAALAFMGLESCMPVIHGSQGCTSFGLVLLVRHFREAIPLQTSAMNEATTIMGGFDNLEQALLNIRSRAQPALIAICSTGLTETKGDDVDGYIKLARQRHPELADTEIVYVSTPDYAGAFQDGWARAVEQLVSQLPHTDTPRREHSVNVLPGSHLSPGDIEELRELIEAFGLQPTFVPDISGSLDGHIPEQWLGTTLGGTPLAALQELGSAAHTLAIGEQMRPAALALQARCAVPFTLFDRVSGLAATDAFVLQLALLSGRAVPQRLRRQRSQLVDAMLDGHFHFGNVKVALAAEPDLLFAAGMVLSEMGAELSVCVTTTRSPLLQHLPTAEVLIGDLEDFERSAAAAGCDLLMTHSHGRQAAERLGKPLFRIGIPMFDRLGNAHIKHVGYRGTRQFIYEVGNLLLAQQHGAHPDDWPLPAAARVAVAEASVPACVERLLSSEEELAAASA